MKGKSKRIKNGASNNIMKNIERDFGIFLKRFFVTKRLFSDKECDTIIEYFERSASTRASVVNTKESKPNQVVSKYDTDVRDGRIVFCDHKVAEMNFAFQKLNYSAIWANFGWSILPLRFLQIAKYDANNDGGFYKSHRDIILENHPQRILSSVTQLSKSEDYTGCNLIFNNADDVAPKLDQYKDKGDTIFFTSIENHEVTPVLTGTRYSLTAWYEGPRIWNSESEYYV